MEIKDIKNAWKNPWSFIVGFLLCAVIVVALFSIDVLSWSWSKNIANVSEPVKETFLKPQKESFCDSGLFEEKLDSWKIKYYDSPDEDGFYCPRSLSSFLSPDIWYKNLIPTNFESIEIRYKLKNKDNSTSTPPSFIFSLGDNPRILRFYAPETNRQIVGFEKIIKDGTDFSTKREEPQYLDEPVAYGTDAELGVKIMISKGNKATFYFKLMYVSALTGKPVENDFSYEVNLPDPMPESEHSKLKIGFATFKGNCIKPISYKFCY